MKIKIAVFITLGLLVLQCTNARSLGVTISQLTVSRGWDNPPDTNNLVYNINFIVDSIVNVDSVFLQFGSEANISNYKTSSYKIAHSGNSYNIQPADGYPLVVLPYSVYFHFTLPKQNSQDLKHLTVHLKSNAGIPSNYLYHKFKK
jgi:hypothetical protein